MTGYDKHLSSLKKEILNLFGLPRRILFLVSFLPSLLLWGNTSLEEVRFGSPSLILPALDGVVYQADRVSGVDMGSNKFSWVGRLQGNRTGFVSLGKVKEEISLKLSLMNGITYFYRGKLEDFAWAQKTKKPKPCGGCVLENGLPRDPRSAQQPSLSWQNGDANLIDLLVVYPSAVTTDAGSTAAIQADIIASVADTNFCYRNSKVNVQLRLVHMEEIVYTPTGIMDTDLDRLKEKADGSMDGVHTIRDQYGADLVALLTTDSDKGGLASTLNHVSLGFEASAFSVNDWDQIGAPSYTLAHEIGHNMGCLHNREDSDNDTSSYDFNAFCFGKRWIDGGVGYRTVMSYDTSPSSTYPTTIPYFSNPDVSYLGTSTGNAGTEDNALVLRSTAPYVSNFRTSVVQGIVADNYDVQVDEGNYTTLGVRLAAQPTSSVSVSLALSGDGDILLGSSSTLSFDSTNWNLLQTVQVHVRPDSDTTADTATLVLSATGIASESVTITEVETGTVTSSTLLVSGTLSNSIGVGIEGVTITLSNGGGSVTTDASGAFSIEVSTGYSGTVTPSKDNYTFTPAQLILSSLAQHSLGNSFVGARSNVLYVDGTASGSGDGSSWTHAYTDLGDALRATVAYDEVWVAQGTYIPGLVRSSHFLIPLNKEVYGGFTGSETQRTQRDPANNLTKLSGDIGISNDTSDNLFHVVIPSQDSLLDGFTISGGNASENFSDDDRGKGAALWADTSTFTVSNCIFSTNLAYQGGAGIYLKDANATFVSCEFSNNEVGSTGSGGAAYLEDSNVSFQYCSFDSNDAGYEAGGIRWENTSGSMIDSNFTGNQNTAFNGGGCLYIKDCSPSILRCRFVSNVTLANNYGGAIKFENSSSAIENSFFISNQSSLSSGGAISIDGTSSPTVSNNEFTSNQAAYGGAMVTEAGATPIISDNLCVSNQASGSGGAFYIRSGSSPTFSSNEFRNNKSSNLGGAIFIDSSDLNIIGDTYLGNWADNGGAIATQGTMTVSIANTRAFGNEANASSIASASAYGGFIYLNSGTTNSLFVNSVFSANKSNYRSGVLRTNGTSRFVNCSLTGNHSGDMGGIAILFSSNSDVTQLDNCIIWGNTATNGGNDIFVNDGTATANYSLFDPGQSSGSISGSNNLNSDPLFTDADGADNIAGTEDDDLSLQSGSPALDLASSSVADYPSTDLLGNARSGNPDMGAYELASNSLPVISTASSVSISENSTSVVQVSATDANGDTLTYSISGGNDQSLFTINSATGALAFNSAPDYETPGDNGSNNVYDLQILVSDGTGSSNLTLEVTVTDSNEAPTISTGSSISISENTSSVVQVSASDPDGDSLSYSITNGADQALFSIDSSSGALSFLSAPDYEVPGDNGSDHVYDLQISVTDGALSDSINLSITVTDVNEDVSVGNIFNSFLSDWTDLSNSQSIGSFFGVAIGPDNIVACGIDGLIATRDHSAGTWSITNSGGNPDFRDVIYADGKFVAIGETGTVLTSVDGSNWTTQNSQVSNDLRNIMWDGSKFIVGASSGGILHSTDGSNWTYYNTGSSIEFNAIAYSGSVYLAVGGYGMVYSTDGISWQSPSSPPASFSMECAAWVGDRFLVSGLNSDIYQSTDGQTWSVALNHSYGFTESIASYNGKTYIVGGSNFILEYNAQTGSFLDANTPLDGSNSLMDVTINGPNVVVVGFNHVVLGKSLDFTNDAPTDLNSTALLTIAENQSIGSTVGIFTATDADANPSLTYHLVSGVGDSDNSLFTLESNGSLLSAQIFDYESNASTYSIRVQVMDEYNASLEAQFSVSLQNMNEAPTITSAFSFSMVENQRVITNITASDPEGDTSLFSIVGGTDDSLFSIGSTSGQLSFTSAPNFESPGDANLDNQYEVQVQAIDPSGLLVTQSITVQVTNANEVPVISSGSSFSVVENGTAVTTVTASDPDVSDALFYSISGADASLFNIFQNGELVFTLAPDFEIPSDANSDNQYELILEVEDGGVMSVTQNLSIQVTDANEAAVITSNSSVSVGENGMSVTTVTATDPESGILTYSIGGGADAALFSITANGELSFLNLPDFESTNDANLDNLYELLVQVIDAGGLSVTQNLSVQVTNLNEAPVITSTSNFSIVENTSSVTTVTASDPDGDALSYSVSGGVDAALFSMTSNGELSFITAPDYENPTDGNADNQYQVEVRGTDPDGLFNAQNLFVTVTDVLDNQAPTDLNSTSPLLVYENQVVGSLVGEFNASDPDGDSLRYSLLSGTGDTDNKSFFLDANGTLTTAVIFDYEAGANRSIRVEVRDHQNASIEAVFQVLIGDVDEEVPVITLIDSANQVLEAGDTFEDSGASWTDNFDGTGSVTGTGTVDPMVPGTYSLNYDFADAAGNPAVTRTRTITVVDTTAPVIAINGENIISIIAGNVYTDAGASWSDLVDGSGTLIGSGTVNTQIPGAYSISYDFSDNAGNPAETRTRTVTVTNQNPSSIHLSSLTVEENQPAGTLVGQLSALDPDLSEGETQVLNFEILSDPETGLTSPFEIDPQGVLKTTASLDFELLASHSVRIRVRDPYGGEMEKDFNIEVMDMHTPIVETNLPVVEASDGVLLSGKVLDMGGNTGDLELGFLVSLAPITDPEDEAVEKRILSIDQAGEFSGYYYPQVSGTFYYTVAYGENAEGIHLGLEEKFVSNSILSSDEWAQAQPVAEAPSWWSSDWFGNYYQAAESPWLLHQDLGWLFPTPSSMGGVWLWQQELGWLWTEQGIYPYLFQDRDRTWLYFYGESQSQRLLYNYGLESWILMEEDPEDSKTENF